MNLRDKLMLSMIGLVLIMWSNAMWSAMQAITFVEPGIIALKHIPAQEHAGGANKKSTALIENIF
ncbi:hypothetical protein [Nitrosomonas sp. Nm166]|uniref:hypothetical protein n=1 Tax=Nitrosomonas sp. Nm166 TaxID=1881054 RepID=UPI0008F04946|nr:hypothetical protein [Nitrosomonas sp. Nm166]SFF18755.1 hypothetical protein SAMN05428977_106614 [Nitrosomonas sp. Nm166]